MQPNDVSKDPRFMGIAGSPQSDQEKANVKQAVFLLRYRIRLHEAVVASDGA